MYANHLELAISFEFTVFYTCKQHKIG